MGLQISELNIRKEREKFCGRCHPPWLW